jgi:hypothetical protein
LPQAIVAAAIAVASAIGEAVTVITTSAALGAAVANGVLALAGAAGIGAFISSWALVASVATAFSGRPKVGGVRDGGTQVDFQANPNAGVPRVLGRTGVGGVIAHMNTNGAANKNSHLLTCAILSLGPIEAIDGFTANAAPVAFVAESATTAPYVGAMDMRVQLGAQPAAAFPPPSVPPGTLAEWTDDHKLSGLAAAWLSLNYSSKVYPTGVPKPNWVVKGPSVYDPRLDSTFTGGSGPQRADDETTWTFAGNDNPYLQALAYLLGVHQDGVRVWGLGLPASAIDVEAFVEGANVAEANGWKIGGTSYTSDPKWDSLVAMLQAGSGMPMRLGGKVSCIVDAPKVSLRTVTGADVVGEAVITGTKARRDRFNSVVPRFRSEAHEWQIVPGGPVRAATYVTEDGATRTREIEFAFCQDKDQAAQLAAYQIVNAREAEPIVLPLKPLYMGFKAGDCLTVDEPELLLNAQKVVVVDRGVDPMTGAATLTVRTETDAKHDFALGRTGTAPPTPSLTGVDPLLVAQPGVGAFTATGGALVGTTGSMPTLVIAGADDNPNATDVLVRYRLSPAGAWVLWPAVHVAAVGDAVRIEITGVADALDYDVEVAYRNVRGVVSAWTSLGTHTAGAISAGGTGDAVPPADITVPPTVTIEQGHDASGEPYSFLNITVVADTADTDVQGYLFEIDDGTGVVDFFSGNAAFQVRGLVAGATYDVKAKVVDTSGNVSVSWSPTGSETVSTGAGQGANLVPNGGLTLGTNLWTVGGWGWSTDPSVGYFFQLQADGTNLAESSAFPVAVGLPYTISLFGAVVNNPTAGDCYMDIEWFTAGSVHISYSARTALPRTATGGDYSRGQITVNAPATAAFGKARIYSEAITRGVGCFVVVTQVKVEQGAAFSGFNDLATSGAIYADGTSIESLKPVDAGATKNKVTRSATTPAGPNGTGDFWVLLDGLGNAVAIRQWNGSAWVTPADLTSVGTAAGISGQSFLATGNPAIGLNVNRLRFTDFEKSTLGWNDGTNVSGLSRSKTTGTSSAIPFLQFSATATAAAQEVSVFTDGDRFAVAPGEQLAVSMVAGSTNGTIKYAVQFYKGDGTFLSTSTGFFFALNATFPTLGQEMVTVPALAAQAYLEVYIDSQAAGSMVAKVGQPYVIGVPAGQTAFPPYVRGASNTAGADVTLTNTAAGFTGQGALATLSAATWSTQVTGSGKPADNADVTSTHTAAAISGQGALATLSAATWSTQVTGSGKPADNADVTSTHTAAAISGQGALATLNDVSTKVAGAGTVTVSTTGGVTTFTGAAGSSGFYLTGNTNACGGNRTGAGTVTTNTVTLTPHNNTGTVSYNWTTPAAGLSPTSPTGAATAFSGFVGVGGDIEGTSVCTATDAGSGATANFAVSVAISENT